MKEKNTECCFTLGRQIVGNSRLMDPYRILVFVIILTKDMNLPLLIKRRDVNHPFVSFYHGVGKNSCIYI